MLTLLQSWNFECLVFPGALPRANAYAPSALIGKKLQALKMFLSAEGATGNSPGQRPGVNEKRKTKALKGRKQINTKLPDQ